jgi:hypothetical protein
MIENEEKERLAAGEAGAVQVRESSRPIALERAPGFNHPCPRL